MGGSHREDAHHYAMGIPAGGTDAAWRTAAEAWFRAQLEQPACFAAFVVDDPLLGVVSAACGICDARAPGPRGLSVVRGHVFSIATDSPRRRRGHARACLTALVAWFRLDTGAETVELSATSDGVKLYTSLGFRERAHPTMRLGLSAPTEKFLCITLADGRRAVPVADRSQDNRSEETQLSARQ